MSTRKGQFVLVVATFLFVYTSCASFEKSEQHFPRKGSKSCLRRCLRRQEHFPGNATRLSSCYHKCLHKKNKGAAKHHGLYSKIVNQRKRKTLGIPPNDDCPDSSPSQTEDWSPQQKTLTFGQYEDTNHWYVNVSWTPMKDTHGRWNATLLSLVVPPPSSGGIYSVNCSIHPKNQTFLQLNLSLYHYQYPNSIYVRILGLPYTADTSSSLMPYTPPIPSTSPSPSHPSDSACLREKNITFQWYPEKVEVHFLQRETKDWYANISWTPLTDPKVSWKGYLVTLFNSKLSSYHPKCLRVPKNQTFAIVDFSNGWEYPDELSLNVTVFESRKMVENTTNFYPPASSLSEETPKFVTIVLPTVAGVVAASVLLLLYRRWRQREHKNVLKTFKYHAFLIHNTSDTEDVKTILSVLESYGLKCCIHWRDFIPGKPYVENIVDSVQNSFKVIAILSRSSFPSECLNFEIQQTLKRLMDNGDDCLILIALDRDVVSNLPQAIRDRSYIDFTERTYRSNWEKRVVEILSKGVVGEDDSLSDTASSSESHYNINDDSQRPISEGSSTGSEGTTLL
ncbi:uncharacterized protein LOC114956901 isoform X2 [Acropora millepora]|uniref:uncharacterized protein LOC114956901 isoform X2 n=1 Tax=Acropora millepora TaxID=45264 RepID=UPI001CF16555|nr:uncharacterized protein LOC114956901 isoform X2 [Acropora millepora]